MTASEFSYWSEAKFPMAAHHLQRQSAWHSKEQDMPRRCRGFNLIEFIIAIMLVTGLSMVATPIFTKFLRQDRVAALSNRLLTELNRARSEAIVRGALVTFCGIDRNRQCNGSKNWSSGLMSFVDADNDRRLDPGETVVGLLGQNDLNDFRLISNSGRPTITFRPDGATAGTNATLQMCDPDQRSLQRIIVNLSGRSRVAPSKPADLCAD